MARENTRDLLLEVGKRTFLERGYGNSGIETIVQAAGVPKGSFYHYFSSKEDFGLKVVGRFAEWYEELMDQTLGDESLPPIERFRLYFERIADRFDADHCRKGCLIGNLSQELANHSEAFRLKLEEIFRRWEDRYAECLQSALDSCEIAPILSVRQTAELWLNGWQGAMLRAKSSKSSAPLRSFLDVMFRHVLRVRPDSELLANQLNSGLSVVGFSTKSTG